MPPGCNRTSDDERAAGALLTVDLGAVRENYRRLAALAAPAQAAAVIKADAYGLGAAVVGPALRAERCGTFFVATLAEGLALRRTLGAEPDIHVLNGAPPGAEAIAAEAGLTVVANSLPQLAAWRDCARGRPHPLPVTLHVDTGMSRLGLSADEVGQIAAAPSLLDGLELKLVASHLSCAEDEANAANAEQLARFEAARRRLPAAPASLANSSGIFLGPAYRFDLVRPGAALYGVNPTPGRPNPMRGVVRLEAKVLQTRSLRAGEAVGYGRTFVATAPTRTATISLGYADGWPRAALAAAFFEEQRLPMLGRVSMDSIVLDITALPEGALDPGALVEVIGENQTVDDVAAAAGTIGYEVLTRLGRRPFRRYLG